MTDTQGSSEAAEQAGRGESQDRLLACLFDYQLFKNGSVQITYEGRVVTTLSGKEGLRFRARVELISGSEQQLLMAKATGNFKRGNEKTANQRCCD